MSDERRRYRINWVAEQTGVAETTLRAWERRYGVPVPARTPSGYRIYSVSDVQKVQRMRELCAAGMSPSEAAGMVAEQSEPAPRPSDGADELRLSGVLGAEHVGQTGVLSLSGALNLMESAATALASLRLRLTLVPHACGAVSIECEARQGDAVTTTARFDALDGSAASVEVKLTVTRENGERQRVASSRIELELGSGQVVSKVEDTP